MAKRKASCCYWQHAATPQVTCHVYNVNRTLFAFYKNPSFYKNHEAKNHRKLRKPFKNNIHVRKQLEGIFNKKLS